MIVDIYKVGPLTYPKIIQCDNGSEFKAEVSKMFEKHEVCILLLKCCIEAFDSFSYIGFPFASFEFKCCLASLRVCSILHNNCFTFVCLKDDNFLIFY